MDDHGYILRAVELAERAAGKTAPNPLVGCVIVRHDQIIGEGWHKGPGTPHAEPDALSHAGEDACGATAYVTLEPCNHHGNTPPCTEAFIEAEVAEVVYACADPNPLAAGGAERLRQAGVRVRHIPVVEAERLIRPWIHGLSSERPYTYAKLAMSLDGRTATRTGDSKWITGPEARMQGHILRQRTDAIMVGVGTVLADDPSLDPRPESLDPVPSLKVIMDTHLRTPPDARLFKSPGRVVIFTSDNASAEKYKKLSKPGVEIVPLAESAGRPSLAHALCCLKSRNCQSVMIEGGGELLGAAFDDGLVDEVWAFIAPMIIGGGKPSVNGMGPDHLVQISSLEDIIIQPCGKDIFFRGVIKKREAASCLQVS